VPIHFAVSSQNGWEGATFSKSRVNKRDRESEKFRSRRITGPISSSSPFPAIPSNLLAWAGYLDERRLNT
jgi:hypothetical protein